MKWNKNILRVLLIGTFLAINALVLFGISSVWSYLNTGADRSTLLHIGGEKSPIYLPEVVWDTTSVEGRPIEKQTLAKIERDYLNGWYVKNASLATNNQYGIADYFTESARTKLYKILDTNKQKGATFVQTTLEHWPELNFYSADGTQISFLDKNVLLYKKGFLNGIPVLEFHETATFQVVMLLEDGFWRVRHFVRVASEPLQVKKEPIIGAGNLEILKNIKGLNYYPKDSPWDTFGNKFNDGIIASDFRKIREMGLNTVRVFIPYSDFGEAHLDAIRLSKVRTLLDAAENEHLMVIITLFDFYGDYSLPNWTLTFRHAEKVVKEFMDHPSLLAWDLKNEPDLDFESRGKDNVLAWLKELNIRVKKWDNLHPITVGWSSPEAAINIADELDFVSFHYYRDTKDFLSAYDKMKNAIPSGKITVLQEYGSSSYSGVWNAFLNSEGKQAAYYEEIQPLLKEAQIPFLFWTLYDFEKVPSAVVGNRPWRREPQKYFGCLDMEGRPKKTYYYLKGIIQK